MINIENIEVWGFKHAIRGMRNPLNSWNRSDTVYNADGTVDIGPLDLGLMKRLSEAGPEHRKFARQILVSMDITAPLYWWKEFDTYKVGTVANSCSTMHKIHDKEFTRSDFSHEHLSGEALAVLDSTINVLNEARLNYVAYRQKDFWWNMIQLLPTSYNQKRTITMNYENVVSIIRQRRGHKLDEWHHFVHQLEELPYISELIGGKS